MIWRWVRKGRIVIWWDDEICFLTYDQPEQSVTFSIMSPSGLNVDHVFCWTRSAWSSLWLCVWWFEAKSVGCQPRVLAASNTWVGEASWHFICSSDTLNLSSHLDGGNVPCIPSLSWEFPENALDQDGYAHINYVWNGQWESLLTATGYPRYDYAARHRTSSAWLSFCKSDSRELMLWD